MGIETLKFSDIDMSASEKHDTDSEAPFLRHQLQESLNLAKAHNTSIWGQFLVVTTLFALICASALGFLTLKQHLLVHPPLYLTMDHRCLMAVGISFSLSTNQVRLTGLGGTPMARPGWRSLPKHRRFACTVAVERLMKAPSRLGLNTSLYDDFTYVHIQLKPRCIIPHFPYRGTGCLFPCSRMH